MPTNYKNAQIQGTSGTGTYSNLYSTSASTTAVISSLVIANTASADVSYRIGITSTSASAPVIVNGEFIVYDAVVRANDTTSLTFGVTLENSKRLYVSSSSNQVCFNAFISEIT